MLPDALLNYSLTGSAVVPHFLGEHDYPWLRGLLDEYERYVGRPRRELDARLREPLPCETPPVKLRLVVRALARKERARRKAPAVLPRKVRALVFEAAARTECPPSVVRTGVATSLGLTPEQLDDLLFAELPGEQLVGPISPPTSPENLALRANLLLVQGLLSRATRVRIEVEGHTRALVRHARLQGLICSVTTRREGTDGQTAMELSGPLALFRKTRLYGRALGGIIPVLAWCPRFRLRAECVLHERQVVLQLRTGDPIFPGSVPRQHDSRVEERFAQEFRKVAPEWDIVREPEPVNADGTLIFPDFAIQCRANPGRRWLLEIVGFWTPDYVSRKLARYRSAQLSNLILCIDAERNCSTADLPTGARIVRFRRRLDPTAVLRLVEA